ncbi:hypothetical protein BC829DRAFT_436205 [Chytridium lagenaria]|nr:hypothetical protein BC829DRAFT_436205 [Chytridium lagenaria]
MPESVPPPMAMATYEVPFHFIYAVSSFFLESLTSVPSVVWNHNNKHFCFPTSCPIN